MKTICLNMIVKNESHVIRRCLEAVKGYIDYWVIVDTGSTDGTQAIIEECMRGYPGKIYERPWKDFAHNRNEALKLASGKADYLLLADADEVFHFTSLFDKNYLDKYYYLLKVISISDCFYSPKLVKDDPHWKWLHVLHEFIQYDGYVEGEFSDLIWIESVQDGARARDPKKNEKDIQILEEAIRKEPENARYHFYLARSYELIKDFKKALDRYRVRSQMQGDRDERFWALFSVGLMQERLKLDPNLYLKSYDRAYQFDPSRAEPLERIANYYFQNDCYAVAYSLMKEALHLPTPTPLTSGYYSWVYDFAIHSVCADCAVFLGKYQEAKELYQKILNQKTCPSSLHQHALSQLQKVEHLLGNNRGALYNSRHALSINHCL